MNAIIKSIRNYLDMSQTELADLLGVTFATVNRWENGHAVPNKLAQTRIFELCQEKNVPVYDMILDKIAGVASQIKPKDGRILLYHGSKKGIEGDIAPVSRKQCDFGKGFYMGTDPALGLTLICDYPRSKFYIMSVALDGRKKTDVPVNIDWAMLVAYHRGKMEKIQGTALYEKYRTMTEKSDLVIGCIANDRMFFVIDNFFQGTITDAALINSLSALQLGKQYVVITQKGCEQVRIEAEIELSHLERLSIKSVAEANREKGISLANDICKNFRREGKYFDELLDKAGG